MGSVGEVIRILFVFVGFCVFLLAVVVLSKSEGLQTISSSPTSTSISFNKASLEVGIRGAKGRERNDFVHHPHPAVAAAAGLDPHYMSKRKVPNGPDPIHNRRTGNSGRTPGKA